MKNRVRPIVITAGALFIVYALGQFVSWLVRNARHADAIQSTIGFVVIALIAAVVGIAGYRAVVRAPSVDSLPPVVVALVLGCVVSTVIGPFAGGNYPFEAGAGDFFQKVWIFLGGGLLGMLLGAWTAIGLGKDYRTTGLKRYAAAKLAKPRRTVGR